MNYEKNYGLWIWDEQIAYLNFFITVSRIASMIADVDFEFGSAR